MSEELKPIGGMEMPKEGIGAGAEGSAEQPLGRIEQARETASETAAERYAEMLANAQGAQAAATSPHNDETIAADAKSVYEETDAEARVAKLVSLAEVKGPVYAVRVAQKLNDLYVLDRMHDELAEKFHEAMKERGMI